MRTENLTTPITFLDLGLAACIHLGFYRYRGGIQLGLGLLTLLHAHSRSPWGPLSECGRGLGAGGRAARRGRARAAPPADWPGLVPGGGLNPALARLGVAILAPFLLGWVASSRGAGPKERASEGGAGAGRGARLPRASGRLRGCSEMKQRLRERRLAVWRDGPARGWGCCSGGCWDAAAASAESSGRKRREAAERGGSRLAGVGLPGWAPPGGTMRVAKWLTGLLYQLSLFITRSWEVHFHPRQGKVAVWRLRQRGGGPGPEWDRGTGWGRG